MSGVEPRLETATLYIPGRASYLTSGNNGTYILNLTEASANRAMVAAEVFEPSYHEKAAFAGGYPGIASWPEDRIPPEGEREADKMSLPLIQRLTTREGWSEEQVRQSVLVESASNSSIQDVAFSLIYGLLDPNNFHKEDAVHRLDLIAGRLHGTRFRIILSKALGIEPSLIGIVQTTNRNGKQVPMRDKYCTPATEFAAKEPASLALFKEVVGIAITRHVMKDVKQGDIDGLMNADEHFNKIVAKFLPAKEPTGSTAHN